LGRTVLDRYTLIRPLGRGGVSLVYEALDLDTIRPVAVKVLAPAFAHNQRTCDAARQEPLIMRHLRHPSVPRVYGWGDAPTAFAGDGAEAMPCVVMELIDGVPLADRLRAGPLHWRQAVETAAMISEMLGVAHRRGIVHRDLTALNVMLTHDGVKIIDFGLATLTGGAAVVGGTHTGVPVAGGSAALAAQDVYAMGVLLYQMLTGRSPYPGAQPHDFAGVRMLRPAPTPVFAGLGIPRAVADLCRDCMAKRPTDRPESADAAIALWSTLI
jgi:serine/threonine-protein kinase